MSTTAMRNIGISLGQLTHFDDGLGEFSYQLGSRLAAAATDLKQNHGAQLWFHCQPALAGCFGSAVNYLAIGKLQRVWHRAPVDFDIWHTLNQLNKTRPPRHSRHRLVTVHDLNYLYFKSAFSRWRDARRMRGLLARTDRVVTISRHVANDVQLHLGEHRSIEVIYNGVTDLTGTVPEPVIEVSPGYLLHLSRMSASKNIAALQQLTIEWPEQHFVFAGADGRDSRRVREWVTRERRLNVSVLLSMSTGQKAWLYANCRAFLFPSITEGFGLPPLEAMYFGKPAFLSKLTSLPEVGGTAAHYFDTFDATTMRRTIERVLAEEATSSAAETVRTHAKRFDWDLCASQYLSLYRAILKQNAPGNAQHPSC